MNNLKHSLQRQSKEKDYDPVTPYGTGVRSYFTMQKKLLRVFAILSALSIPMLIIYASFGGMSWNPSAGLYQKLSFGNMGYSGPICVKTVLNNFNSSTVVPLYSDCQGTTQIKKVSASGLMS